MSRFVKTVLSNPDKLVSNNIWFTTDCDWHIGDHVLGGQTKHLINTFERVREICEQTSIHSPYIPLSHFGLDGFHGIPEPIICLSYLQSKGIAIKDDKANKIMREHTEVVCVSKMGNFIVRSNGANWTITSYNEVMRLAPRVISSLENL